MNKEEQEKRLYHARNPQPGDYWHEMYCPVLVVLDVDKGKGLITICKDIIYNSKEDTWRWNLNKTEIMPLGFLATYLAYSGDPSKGLWARVIPGHMLDVVKEWKGE